MKLTELEPEFLKIIDEKTSEYVVKLEEADGVLFVCPKCLHNNGYKREGVHSVICWEPNVPQTRDPKPGRWVMQGTGFADLTLVAGSSSVLLTDGCRAHFYVRNGEIVEAEPW